MAEVAQSIVDEQVEQVVMEEQEPAEAPQANGQPASPEAAEQSKAGGAEAEDEPWRRRCVSAAGDRGQELEACNLVWEACTSAFRRLERPPAG